MCKFVRLMRRKPLAEYSQSVPQPLGVVNVLFLSRLLLPNYQPLSVWIVIAALTKASERLETDQDAFD